MNFDPDDPDVPPEIQAMARLNLRPEVQFCFQGIKSVAGFELEDWGKYPFLLFQNFLKRNPSYLEAWKTDPDPKVNHWFHDHVGGMMGDVQNAAACVFYHRQNLSNIERDVQRICKMSGAKEILGRTSISLGNTLRWDFEYQAFVLSVRRCLEYLTRAFAAYFKHQFHSFNDIEESLVRQMDRPTARAIVETRVKFSAQFAYVTSNDGIQSLRDKITHRAYVSATYLCLHSGGYFMKDHGAPDQIVPIGSENGLGVAIENHTRDLVAFLAEVVLKFTEAAEVEMQGPLGRGPRT